MGNKRLPKLALNSSQNQLHLKRCWCKDIMAWLNHWGIDESDILQNIDNVKNVITSKFKDKLWCEENLVVKRKLTVLLTPTLHLSFIEIGNFLGIGNLLVKSLTT